MMKRIFLQTLVLLLFLGTSNVAFAQQEEGMIWGIATDLWTTTTSTTTTAAAAGGVVLTILLIQPRSAEVAAYLEHNAVAVQHDLYMGGGETTRDLAELFAVPAEEHERFARQLFELRHELAPLIEGGAIDAEKANRFTEIVTRALHS